MDIWAYSNLYSYPKLSKKISYLICNSKNVDRLHFTYEITPVQNFLEVCNCPKLLPSIIWIFLLLSGHFFNSGNRRINLVSKIEYSLRENRHVRNTVVHWKSVLHEEVLLGVNTLILPQTVNTLANLQ